MKVAVVGQGYVGLPLAIAANSAGHDVVGIDLNSSLVDLLNDGKSSIGDLSDQQINAALETGKYKAEVSFAAVSSSEVVVICVPTPLNAAHEPDLSLLQAAVESISQNLSDDTLIILESTVSPGTTRDIIVPILNQSKKVYRLAYSPERIDPANKKWNITNTPKLVAGLDERSTKQAIDFYKTFVDSVIPGSSIEVIETAKLLENSFRLINISFINEIADFCSKMGIDVREVVEVAATKPYGFMPFYPGAGVGGHCIPVDPSYLVAKAKAVGVSTKFIDLANNINRSLPTFFTGVATGILGTLKEKRILLVGIAYKPNVSDTRESPALGLIQALRAAGAKVSWHDELVNDWQGEQSSPLSESYDLAILVNPHSVTNLAQLGSVKVLDTRGGY